MRHRLLKKTKTNFQIFVDRYITASKVLGREPQKIYKGVFNVRIDPELHKSIYHEALKAGISRNAFVQKVLKKEV